jgi:hypothetical protein
MKPSDLKGIFEPIVEQVIELVKGQVEATHVQVKAVLLVGGFGQSNYLKERLRSSLNTETDKIEVLQPPHAWSAVVRGAVMKGLSNYDNKLAMVRIGRRMARKHYGVMLASLFDPAIHREATKYAFLSGVSMFLLIYSCRFWDPFDSEYCANSCMSWFIKRVPRCQSQTRHAFTYVTQIGRRG